MQNWKDLYTELAEAITTELPKITWIDLWHNQVNFLSEEHPFPTPAVFLNFRTANIQDTGIKVQQVNLQVDCYIYYETFADTYAGAYNQSSALEFLELLNDVYALFHGRSGENYSNMRRIAFNPVDTGSAGNLYQLTFECVITDYAAMKLYDDVNISGIDVERGNIDVETPDLSNGYVIPG